MNNINTSSGQESAHSFFSKARNGLKIDGVCDVVSFDEGGAVLLTVCGNMAIEGEGIHVTVLNISDGTVEISGKINGLYYFDDKPTAKRGLFRKRADGE
jgi:sporulation protein YabP